MRVARRQYCSGCLHSYGPPPLPPLPAAAPPSAAVAAAAPPAAAAAAATLIRAYTACSRCPDMAQSVTLLTWSQSCSPNSSPPPPPPGRCAAAATTAASTVWPIAASSCLVRAAHSVGLSWPPSPPPRCSLRRALRSAVQLASRPAASFGPDGGEGKEKRGGGL